MGAVPACARSIPALRIAGDHLREVCRLPTYVDVLERSLAIATRTASERLVRVAALAYLLCERDRIRDDLPAGNGLVDDCISIRGAGLATPDPRPRAAERHHRGRDSSARRAPPLESPPRLPLPEPSEPSEVESTLSLTLAASS